VRRITANNPSFYLPTNSFFIELNEGTDVVSAVNKKTEAEQYYHGCLACWDFSMLFGGCLIGGKKIKSDEDFEIEKEKFVKHFNEKHRNLMVGKQKTKGKFRKMGFSGSEVIGSSSVMDHNYYPPIQYTISHDTAQRNGID